MTDPHDQPAEEALVLIVDDEPTTRMLMREALTAAGFAVEEAEDGIVALRRVADNQPTLILLDLMMPRMDGFDFLSQLRKNSAWKHIPVVVLTAMDLGAEDLRPGKVFSGASHA